MEQDQIIKRKRGQRGLGKKPAMVQVSIRVPEDTMQFYRGRGASRDMRQALEEFVKKHS